MMFRVNLQKATMLIVFGGFCSLSHIRNIAHTEEFSSKIQSIIVTCFFDNEQNQLYDHVAVPETQHNDLIELLSARMLLGENEYPERFGTNVAAVVICGIDGSETLALVTDGPPSGKGLLLLKKDNQEANLYQIDAAFVRGKLRELCALQAKPKHVRNPFR